MIKYVVQSIPTYAMSCFRIPKYICDEIKNACANFWWGEEKGKKRLHWKSWKTLCRPKCMGGLVFRHLDIMAASLGSNSSYIWRSILWSQSLLEKGFLWHVGNREHISTFDDRWLPDWGCFSPTPLDRTEYGTVNTLINNGRWN